MNTPVKIAILGDYQHVAMVKWKEHRTPNLRQAWTLLAINLDRHHETANRKPENW
jgi:hypothetical protein